MIPEREDSTMTSPKKCITNGHCTGVEERAPRKFRPQVEVHLKKGVAKSQLEGKLPELEALIKKQKSLRNWIPAPMQDLVVGDELKCLAELVQGIMVGCMNYSDAYPLDDILDKISLCDQNVHFYKLHCDGAMSQSLSVDENSDENAMGSLLWELPCAEFENLWENLIYDTDIKNELMSYVHALIQLSDKGADMKVINVNRLIILLGPPGTGKTTLCRGIAQHLSIRLNANFSTSVMVEINSHSLFSKWFSEVPVKLRFKATKRASSSNLSSFLSSLLTQTLRYPKGAITLARSVLKFWPLKSDRDLLDVLFSTPQSGKLVLKMFDQIDEMAEDGKCLVFVLIDEVESLGMSRDASTSRGDPADSIRAVNALLTQIDRIRRRPNVIVLCTSNLEDCLDRALLDRADVVKHVGQPSAVALYSILAKCIEELIRIGVVSPDERLPSIRELKDQEKLYPAGCELLELAKLAQGLSGRSIRQVPALAWSKADGETVTLQACLSLFKEAILEKAERCK